MAGLYIHIPFCRSKCAYCDFYSAPERGRGSEFVRAIENEWSMRRGEIGDGVETVYIGGGTPSSLDRRLLDRIFGMLGGCNSITEFTIEVNPEDISDEFVRWLGSTPVNRVSMGIQSFNDIELAAISRRHSSADAVRAFNRLRQGGIGNISCDLIYGLPEQTMESWAQSLERLIEMKPEHLSAYLLSYEEGTRLWVRRETGKISEASEELAGAMYRHLTETAANNGYNHYEISNFALDGFESRHNSSYWSNVSYLGLGPGAHSCIDGQRSYNRPSLKDYIDSSGIGCVVADPETDTERYNDLVITSLRTAVGLDVSGCGDRAPLVEAAARPHLQAGRMKRIPGGRLRIAEDSWLIADRIMLDFIEI